MPRIINQGKADWKQWKLGTNTHGSMKTGAKLMTWLDGQYYRVPLAQRTVEEGQARAWIHGLAAVVVAAGVPAAPPAPPPPLLPAAQPVAPFAGHPGFAIAAIMAPGPLPADHDALGDLAEDLEDDLEDTEVGQIPETRKAVVRLTGAEVTAARDHHFAKHFPKLLTEDGWTAGWDIGNALGSGGMARTFIFKKIEEGRLLDRVVVKDAFPGWQSWGRVSFWHGDPKDVHQRVPMEIKCMQRIAGRPDSVNCVQIRGQPKIDNDRMVYRIYMGYCPHGDLVDIMLDRHRDERILPEPALWSIFNDLVDACLVLEYGAIDPDDAVPGWTGIVHRDFKPANIFLDAPAAKTRFPSYPTARMGDFGFAIMTSENDALNPTGYNEGVGTQSWQAPEQLVDVDTQTLVPQKGPKLGEKTNVWGIGATLLRLMNLQEDGEEIGPFDAEGEKVALEFNLDGGLFSPELQDLVTECVSWKPDDRPSLRTLRERILAVTTRGQMPDYARGLRDADPAITERVPLGYPRDPDRWYALGLAQSVERVR